MKYYLLNHAEPNLIQIFKNMSFFFCQNIMDIMIDFVLSKYIIIG
jgi:hypothetical protein